MLYAIVIVLAYWSFFMGALAGEPRSFLQPYAVILGALGAARSINWPGDRWAKRWLDRHPIVLNTKELQHSEGRSDSAGNGHPRRASVKRETRIEHYYAPPRGLNNLRTHAKLLWGGAVMVWVCGPTLLMPAVSHVVPDELRAWLADQLMALVWVTGMVLTVGAIITTWMAYRRLGLAATYGLPEPGIREWPSCKRRIDELRHSR